MAPHYNAFIGNVLSPFVPIPTENTILKENNETGIKYLMKIMNCKMV